MNLALSPESMAWLKAQIESGQFASYEEAIDYSVKLTALRETLHASIADPRRYSRTSRPGPAERLALLSRTLPS